MDVYVSPVPPGLKPPVSDELRTDGYRFVFKQHFVATLQV